MTYSLGVDLGTTFVAAAVARPSGVEMCALGERSMVAPAVVAVLQDGTVVTGDAAERREISRPDLACREVRRRLGDPAPIRLGTVAYRATSLLATQLRDVVRRVADIEGAPPERIALASPARWGPLRRQLFDEVASVAGLEAPVTVVEAVAAARHALSGRLPDGEIVAVYDLGGGTFDATVVRKQGHHVEVLGTPDGIDMLGGVDLDEAVLAYVDRTTGGALARLDRGDQPTAVALTRLRQDCVLAKEALSWDTDTVIPVALPGRHGEVRLTRASFEAMVRAPLEATIAATARALGSAGLAPSDLGRVLLIGGSSRIPLVQELVSQAFGFARVEDDVHPKHSVALGAATIASASLPAVPGPAPARHQITVAPPRPVLVAAASPTARADLPREVPEPWSPPEPPPVPAVRARPRSGAVYVAVVLAVLVLAVVCVLIPARSSTPFGVPVPPRPSVVPSAPAQGSGGLSHSPRNRPSIITGGGRQADRRPRARWA